MIVAKVDPIEVERAAWVASLPPRTRERIRKLGYDRPAQDSYLANVPLNEGMIADNAPDDAPARQRTPEGEALEILQAIALAMQDGSRSGLAKELSRCGRMLEIVLSGEGPTPADCEYIGKNSKTVISALDRMRSRIRSALRENRENEISKSSL